MLPIGWPRGPMFFMIFCLKPMDFTDLGLKPMIVTECCLKPVIFVQDRFSKTNDFLDFDIKQMYFQDL